MSRCGCSSGGCGCSILEGDNIIVTGHGSLDDPWIISASGGGGSGGPPLEGTYYVASNNARPEVKAMADYVCDGVADEVQIQAAIDAAIIHGFGLIQLSEGNFILSDTIHFDSIGISNNQHLRGVSPGGGDYNGPIPSTFLVRPISMTVPALVVANGIGTSFTNLGFQEHLDTSDKDPMISLLTGGGTVLIEHCYFPNPTSTTFPPPRARFISGNTGLKLRYSSFSNAAGACVALAGNRTYQIEIIGNYFYTAHSDGGAFGANEYVIMIEGPNIPAPEGADYPFIISHNFSDGNVRGTVQVTGTAQGIISDNEFYYDSEPTILIDQCYEIQVHSNGFGGTDTEVIKITNSTYCQINDNQIIEPGTHGISLSGTNDSQINNNTVVAGTEASSAGIFIDADSNTNMVTGNLIRGTTLYGIRVNNANCDDNWITNNDLKNSGVTPFSDVGTGTVVTAGNRS